MTSRRSFLFGLSASLIAAPSVVHAASLMTVRGVVMPIRACPSGFIKRDFTMTIGVSKDDGKTWVPSDDGTRLAYLKEHWEACLMGGPKPTRIYQVRYRPLEGVRA